jgi:hypothetical protein
VRPKGVCAPGLLAVLFIDKWQAPLLDVHWRFTPRLASKEDWSVGPLEVVWAPRSPGRERPNAHFFDLESCLPDRVDHQIVGSGSSNRDQRSAWLQHTVYRAPEIQGWQDVPGLLSKNTVRRISHYSVDALGCHLSQDVGSIALDYVDLRWQLDRSVRPAGVIETAELRSVLLSRSLVGMADDIAMPIITPIFGRAPIPLWSSPRPRSTGPWSSFGGLDCTSPHLWGLSRLECEVTPANQLASPLQRFEDLPA